MISTTAVTGQGLCQVIQWLWSQAAEICGESLLNVSNALRSGHSDAIFWSCSEFTLSKPKAAVADAKTE